MGDLIYRIGEIQLVKELLNFQGTDSYNAAHKFIVHGLDDIVSIFVAHARSHNAVRLRFGLEDDNRILVGGGSFYLNNQVQLVLDDYSGNYGAVPIGAVQKFGELLVPEMQKQGIITREVIANPAKGSLADFWRERGFKQ